MCSDQPELTLVRRALTSGERITGAYLTRMKKELIEKEAAGRLEFLESSRTLDDVAGHDAAKAWMREDALLLKRGRTMAIPMGYLLTGRIGTGKTYLVECLAGEIGIPCVELKNFREKWVGSTEGNLEKILQVVDALGYVLLILDEADRSLSSGSEGDGVDTWVWSLVLASIPLLAWALYALWSGKSRQ